MKVAVVIALLCAGGSLAAEDCARCHPAEATLHSRSAHAAALMTPAGSPFVSHLSGKPLSEGEKGYAFVYNQNGGILDALSVTARKASDAATAPLVWIFGSGRQGQTPMLSYRGHFIEHRVSYYTATGYGITIGQENGISKSAVEALGRIAPIDDARVCFNCHATAVSRDLTSLTPGVQCVRCHAGAEEHQKGHGTPVNPGKLDHVAQVRLCGECHRLNPVSGTDDDIGNVRFQPLRLMKSACFRKGDIECTTCHPAHRNAQRDAPNVYNRACLACHPDTAAHIVTVKSGNCVQCHMPKVSPAPALTFTDHFIRVVSKTR